MRRHFFDLVVLFLVASAATGYVVSSQPGIRELTLRIYVLVVGGLLMLGLISAVAARVPRRSSSAFDRALAETAPVAGPLRELERLEREVTLATASAYDLHVRLLPSLREIAEARLAQSGRVPSPATLGRWWELLRDDRPAPDDHFAPGISADDLRALVADLARM